MNPTALTDTELWKNIQQDDVSAYNVLFERYWSAIYTTSYSYVRDNEACSSIVHDIFINIWQKRHTLEINSFKSYFTSAARYHMYRYMTSRNTSKLDLIEDYNDIPTLLYTDENQGAQRIRADEFENELENLLVELPKRCQEIFHLSRKEHLSNDAIAQKLGISKRTVENQITSALKHIRQHLKDIPFVLLLLYISKS